MFDSRYLDRMTVEELHTLEDGVIESFNGCRARKQWALAWWWRQQQTAVMEAIYRAHMETADPRFSRAQTTLDGMPPRQAPELR